MSDGEAITLEQALRIQLEQQLGPVLYSDLAAHLARDAVFVVAQPLSIVGCAVAIAKDDVAQVEPWIRAGALRKPTAAEREAWPTQAGRVWMAIVVQPFVLVQDAVGS